MNLQKDNFADDTYEEDDENEKLNHFKRDFDEDLSTFKNLYSRLSNRKLPHPNDKSPSSKESHPLTATSNTTGYSYTIASQPQSSQSHSSPPSSSSSNNNNEPSGKQAIIPSTLHTKETPITTINYSNKPPSDLSNNFKCIVLAKNGKRVR